MSRSLLILAISCTFQASSRTIRSRSRFSIASKNFFCNSSCFSITSFISLSKKSCHFLFLLRRPSNCSSEEVDEELLEFEIRSADRFGKEDGIAVCEGFVAGGGGRIVGFVGGNEGIVVTFIPGETILA